MKKTLSALSIAALAVGSANAAHITGTTIQSADVGANGNMTPSDAIDGQGLNENGVLGPANTPALVGTHSNTWNDNWWSNSATGQITIDLEGNYSINAV